jgi:zinc transport system ATP-binding protein
MSILDCNKLTIGYEGKPLLSDLSFSVNPGNILCILGDNGSGKTTLMKTLLGLKSPMSGSVSYDPELSNVKIGYVSQQMVVKKDFPATVSEVVRSGCLNNVGLRLLYTEKEKQYADNNMDILGIKELSKSSYMELSGGQQRRVLIARALCAAGSLLFLDEPASGLDSDATHDLYAFIDKLCKDTSIATIMISHDIVAAISVATHIIHLEQDRSFYGTKLEYLYSEIGSKYLEDVHGRR